MSCKDLCTGDEVGIYIRVAQGLVLVAESQQYNNACHGNASGQCRDSSAGAAQPYARLCVGSAESEDQQVRRPYLVQVQSPISRPLARQLVSYSTSKV